MSHVERRRPTLAVWKFSSCDGCQLSLLDCEDELLALADAISIAYFPEASSRMLDGPYDISLVEGSITTSHDMQRIRDVRQQSSVLITIGACATSGGIQALRNFADVEEFMQTVYAHPEYLNTLKTSTSIAEHVEVDYELRGCPVSKQQLLETINALLNNRAPNLPRYSVCEECKRAGNSCVMVTADKPCLGPVTQAGCGAICPGFNRACYGCFGPLAQPNTSALSHRLEQQGMKADDISRVYRSFNAAAPAFQAAGDSDD